MTKETVSVVTLTPDEGMYLFNPSENIYSDKVITRSSEAKKWQEVPYSQYEQWLAEEEERLKAEEEARLLEEEERRRTEEETREREINAEYSEEAEFEDMSEPLQPE